MKQRNFSIAKVAEIVVGPWKAWKRKDEKLNWKFNYDVVQITHGQTRQKENGWKKRAGFQEHRLQDGLQEG